jgi:hypothetical protein
VSNQYDVDAPTRARFLETEVERLRAELGWVYERADEATRRVDLIETCDPLSATTKEAALRSLGYVTGLGRGDFRLDDETIRHYSARHR